jgi:hypothetical protein
MKPTLRTLGLAVLFWLALTASASLSLGTEDPWTFLEDFTPLPSTLTRIGENYVAVLFENRQEQLLDAVIFKASCFAGSCELVHRAGYAVSNTRGSNTRVYVDPSEDELMTLMGVIASRYSRDAY